MKYLVFFRFAVAGLLFTAAPAWTQSSNGSVRGTVQDTSQAIIPNGLLRSPGIRPASFTRVIADLSHEPGGLPTDCLPGVTYELFQVIPVKFA